jgi:hypothetical protein
MDEYVPLEVLTGTVTRLGERDIENWKAYRESLLNR